MQSATMGTRRLLTVSALPKVSQLLLLILLLRLSNHLWSESPFRVPPPSQLLYTYLPVSFLNSNVVVVVGGGLVLVQGRNSSEFSLRHFHLGLSHLLWRQFIKPGDVVVDATCGNGHDSLALAK